MDELENLEQEKAMLNLLKEEWQLYRRRAELQQLQLELGEAMLTDFRTLQKDDNLDRAIELTLAGSQKDFPVVSNGNIEGAVLELQ